MSAATGSVERSLTHRSTAQTSTTTGAISDDEAIPDSDSSETTNLFLERLRAWKHMCGYLEEYISATAKVQKSQSKDYEKILKTVSDPLRENHHFSQAGGGVGSFFENLRANTQGMINMYLETEKNLKGSVLPILERLHKEIKNKSKELTSGASKTAKAVEKARAATQKHIDLLGQHTAHFDAAAGNRVDVAHDPYVLKRGVNHRLNKQIIEENNNRQDILAVQNSFREFEAHVIQVVQGALDQFFQLMGGQMDRQRAMYADILSNIQQIPLDFEWVNFLTRNDHILVNPDSAPRSFANVSFPNQDHRATQPLLEGTLERKSRAMLRGYSSGYYVVTPAGYLHEFKDDDDFRHEPAPELSLYLPDCVIGAIDGVKFNVKGKDVSGGKVGSAFHHTTELSFKAHTPSDAEAWWKVIKEMTRGPGATSGAAPVSPIGPPSPVTPVAAGAAVGAGAGAGAAAGAATATEATEKEPLPEPTTTTAPATETKGLAPPATAGTAASDVSKARSEPEVAAVAAGGPQEPSNITTMDAPPAFAGNLQPGQSQAALERSPSGLGSETLGYYHRPPGGSAAGGEKM